MYSDLSTEIKRAVKEALSEVGASDRLAYTVRSFAKAADMGQTSVRAEIKAGRLNSPLTNRGFSRAGPARS